MDQEQWQAFDGFARSQMPNLLRFGLVLTGSPHEASDLVQEALTRTAMAWPRVVRKDDPGAYVRRVMVNRRINLWHRYRREILVADPTDRDAPRTGEHVGSHDLDLWSALATLPRRQRAVLVLRYYEDLSEADTAAVLGCSVGTVKSQASKAMAKLREPGRLAALRGEEAQS